MSQTTATTLTEDEIDDILYFSRISDTPSLTELLSSLSKTHSFPPSNLLAGAVDPATKNTAIHYAAANGHVEMLKHLNSNLVPTDCTALINAQNSSGNTALHWAALNGHLEAVKLLLGWGADVEIKNAAGHIAWTEAAVNGKEEVVAWLEKEGRVDLGEKEGVEEDVAGKDDAGAEWTEGSGGGARGDDMKAEGERSDGGGADEMQVDGREGG